MNALGKTSPAEARRLKRPIEDYSPFELMWAQLSESERLHVLCGSGSYGWFQRTDPDVRHLVKDDNGAYVEMALMGRGWSERYLQGDYEKCGSKDITEWGE